jgi:Transposase DDE domain
MHELQLMTMFCDIDDFCKQFEPIFTRPLLQAGHRHRTRQTGLALSEIMTSLVAFHCSHYRTCKHSYLAHVEPHLRPYFPTLVRDSRLVALLPRALVPRGCYWHTRQGRCTGIAFLASTPRAVCHTRRIKTHRVFAEWATRGKTSMGWFDGFKLPLLVNDAGEWLAFCLTPGPIDDRKPVPKLAQRLFGHLFGERGYLSPALHDALCAQGLELLTKIRKHMQHRLMRLWEKLLRRTRALSETMNDQLKNLSQIAHTRHRSVTGFMVPLMAGLGA